MNFLPHIFCHINQNHRITKQTQTALLAVFCAFIAIAFQSCSTTSAYNGGSGSFSEYEDWGTYEERPNRSYDRGSQNAYKNFAQDTDDLDTFLNSGSQNPSDAPEQTRAGAKQYKVGGSWYEPQEVNLGDMAQGLAGWYGADYHAKKTSSGETYDIYAHTAAHRTYPMGTILRIYNLENGNTTIVRINDRGPFTHERLIDVSNAAARDLGIIESGLARVKLEVIGFKGVVNTKLKNALNDESLKEEFKVGYTAKSVDGGAFLIQLDVFKNKDGALNMREQYSIYTPYEALVREMRDASDQILYRVFLGGFKSENEARDFMKHNDGLEGKILIRD